MAHGFLKTLAPDWHIASAGTEASGKLNHTAVLVMQEAGIDISSHTSDPVEKYLHEEWDYVITVCGGANENCPTFNGQVKNRLHVGFEDPSHVQGSKEFIYSEFRRIRDLIQEEFTRFYNHHLSSNMNNEST